MKMTWLERVLVVVVVLVVAGYELAHNPIRLHQVVEADGLTMQVPAWWTPVTDSDKQAEKGILVALRREWAFSGTVTVMDRKTVDPENKPWSMNGARRQQVDIVAVQKHDGHFSDPQFLDLKAGEHRAACEEARTAGKQALICYVVGTPLEFTYLGSARYEGAARGILASLR